MIDQLNPSRQATACCHKLQGDRRAGVTLIELLIVVSLIVLIAGLTLPSVRGLLKDQRTVQSARVVQGLLESARARAIAMDRPVAAIFERVGTNDSDAVGLHTCNRMSIGEVFPPYEGDWANTTGSLQDGGSDGYPDFIQIPISQCAFLLGGYVSAGDYIELGDRKLGFTITKVESKPTSNPTHVFVYFQNPPVNSEPRWLLVNGSAEARFRIYRKPSKTMTSSILLPRGTSIDLGWSGFGTAGIELATSTSATPAKRSIYVVFNPRGAVDSVYEFQQTTSATDVIYQTATVGMMHLLVGRTDQINLTAADQVSTRDDVQSNLADSSNKWVTLNTRNGQVYTSDVGPPDAADPVVFARVLATRRLTGKD